MSMTETALPLTPTHEPRTLIGNSTGRAYRVYWHETCQCWTYEDDRRYGPSLGWVYHQHPTADAAEQAAQDRDRLADAEGHPLSREEYEQECARLGVPCYPDVVGPDRGPAVDDYWVHYGEFGSPPYTVEDQIKVEVARRRMRAIRTERENEPKPEPAPEPESVRWGAHGVRYDEQCPLCDREGTVDNDSGCCRGCS